MRKFIALLICFYFATLNTAHAFIITTTMLADFAVSSLLPILKPIAEKAIKGTAEEIHGIITGTRCPIICQGAALVCKTAKGLSTCKASCQKIQPVGGYEIKIRFGDNWSLASCVRQGIQSGKKKPEGKGNSKSIAIYSQKDLDNLLGLIAMQMAARQVIDTKGAELTDSDLKAAKITRADLVKESKDLIDHIDASIEKNVTNGVYGNQ